MEEVESVPSPQPWLAAYIRGLADLRQRLAPLRHGSYRELLVAAQQFAFARETPEGWAMIVLNAAEKECELNLPLPSVCGGLRDELVVPPEAGGHITGGAPPTPHGGRVKLSVPARGARVIVPV